MLAAGGQQLGGLTSLGQLQQDGTRNEGLGAE